MATSPWDLRPTKIGGQRLRGRPCASVDGGGKGGAFFTGEGVTGEQVVGEKGWHFFAQTLEVWLY